MTGDNDVQLSVMVQQLQQVRNAFSGDTLTSIYDKQQNNTTNLSSLHERFRWGQFMPKMSLFLCNVLNLTARFTCEVCSLTWQTW